MKNFLNLINRKPASDADPARMILAERVPKKAEMHVGDLIVEGHVCLDRPDDVSQIYIFGDVKIDGILCLSNWDKVTNVVIAGSLQADGIVVTCELRLTVLKDLQCRVLLNDCGDLGAVKLSGNGKIGTYIKLGSGTEELDAVEIEKRVDHVPEELSSVQEVYDRISKAGSVAEPRR